MCNEAARRTALGLMREDFSQLKIHLRFPEGLPNLGEAPSIRITDTTVIVRAARHAAAGGATEAGGGAAGAGDPGDALAAEMVQRRWSWVGGSPGAAASKGAGRAGQAAGQSAGQSAGKPVYNFRSEGRRFDNGPTSGRCLIPLDGFYEFTDPGTAVAAHGSGGGDRGDSGGGVGASALTLPLQGQWAPPSPWRGEGKKKKDKWLFTLSPDAGAAWNPGGRAAPGLFAVAGLWRAGVDIGRSAGGSAAGGATGEAFTMLTCEPGPDIAPYHKRQIVLIPRDRWADWLGIGGGDGSDGVGDGGGGGTGSAGGGASVSGGIIAPTPRGTLVVARA